MHDVSHSYAKLIAQGEQIPFALQADGLMLALRTLPAVTHVCSSAPPGPAFLCRQNMTTGSGDLQAHSSPRPEVLSSTTQQEKGEKSQHMLRFPQVISSPISFSRNPECKAIIYCWHVQCNAELQRQLNNPKMKVTVGAHR